jgi:spore coat protein CotF
VGEFTVGQGGKIMNWKSDKTGKANPRLKASFLEVVENQLKANDPPETKQTLDRLIAQGISRDDSIIYIAQAVCTEVWDVLRNKNPYNRQRYIKNLKNLPEEPKV